MPAGIQSVDLAIQHMRYHRQGIPVVKAAMSECVCDSFQGQTLGNLRVFIHVPVVVVIDELAPAELPEADLATWPSR